MINYIENPKPTDTVCLSDLARAKRDAEEGKIAMNDLLGLDQGNRRYSRQLKNLIEEQGLIFRPEGEYCVVYGGQTQGCYSLYMDRLIAEQFGADFKKRIHERADSLYFEEVRNDTIWHWYCDEEPELLPDHSVIEREIGGGIMFLGIIIETDVQVPENKIESMFPSDKYPTFVDVDITIDKNGDVTKFEIDSLRRLESDKVLYDKLFPLAVGEIKKNYSRWKPGIIRGEPVNTTYEFRVYFKNKAI
ncbi:hypothetical protein C7460_1273 [Marinoscillum furvescens DSM 4134]|uniref:Uncharacterized protein n=2 Tax=Marinoscillum furvescens TaxID=1026 RepID=A0A3D9KWT6_MARFU|nr:hypothetical protein C7460_1273 [Marinoscillum furvescens DSM 4134]